MQTKTSSDQHIYQHIDPSVLDGIRAQLPGRPELIGRIVASFLQSSPMLLDNIRIAVQSGDAEAVRISAHTMKSSNAQVGATRLAEICQELESLATAKHLAGTTSLLTELTESYQGVTAELQLLCADWAGQGGR